MKHRVKTRYCFDWDTFIKAFILFGFWGLLAWLNWTQQLTLYIHAKFSGIVTLAGYLLLPLFLIQFMTIIRPVGNNCCSHQHSRFLTYIPFLLFLTLAFGLQTNTLNATMAANKGLTTEKSITPSTLQMSRPLAGKQLSSIPVTDQDYTEIMNELEFFSQDYIGKEISMTGFVFRPPAVSSTQFSLVRYVIICCVADALPYGVLCELKNAGSYEDGTWLSIQGVIGHAVYEEKSVPVVKITSVKKIKEPKSPYVFPPAE